MGIEGANNEPQAINKIGQQSALTGTAMRLTVVPKGIDHVVVASDGAGSTDASRTLALTDRTPKSRLGAGL
jgi:hypothetical protein